MQPTQPIPPVPPSWFKQRQGKAESAGPELYKLTAPNLPESYIGIHRADNDRWSAFLRPAPDAAALAVTDPEFVLATDAWEAAFELYRTHLVT